MTQTSMAQAHVDACRGFGAAVVAASGKWSRPSPCDGWDARAVVEHVIGFHDVLLLRPFGAKPQRPRDDVLARWDLTCGALQRVLARPGLFDRVVEVPAVGNNPPMQVDARVIVPMLTQDVLVHTWDLARAVGADDRLDEGLCARCLERLPQDPEARVASGMYAAPVAVDSEADVQSQLLALLGRDPAWRPGSLDQ